MEKMLWAVDPAKSKLSVAAMFVDGKFMGFNYWKYKGVIAPFHFPFKPVFKRPDTESITVVFEIPYINLKHSIKNQLALTLAIGEMAQAFNQQGYLTEYANPWGNGGWIQSFFGQKTKREDAIIRSKQIAEADGVELGKNYVHADDEGMAYCLGLWWLNNNRGR